MRRVVEKVKDIVEICPFTHLHDFAADPSLTLAGYHFTDITADLMSKWIDRAATVRTGNGAALALAGFRGVGKSHFLAVVGAIAARPELRTRISDPHVATSAERLPRRHGSVALVRRGTGTSLLDEVKRAVCPILGVAPSEVSDSIYDLLLRSDEASGDAPLLILIDTALGRESRVSRDDGALLSEIGEAAKAIGVFVGVALDDDISGADGPNASISGTFGIDYLDQEHLYRIVDSAIFSKHNQMRPVLHDIYEDYRAELPGFRWSEQRFSSLYPLHPATVEVAPLVRLYIHDFALLGFAADAGVKILGRPAHSLIGLEEVFDSTESRLRFSPELSSVFETFDGLERSVVAKVPVLTRHPAKLMLKGLLLLSLGGEGATADEIAASMMISGAHALDISGLLDSFFEAASGNLQRHAKANGQTAYGFRLTSRVDAESLLVEASRTVPASAIQEMLRGQFAERYADFNAHEAISSAATVWRGGIRRGNLIWPPAEDGGSEEREPEENVDWEIRVGATDLRNRSFVCATKVIWRFAELTAEELDAVRRCHVLCRNAKVREQLGDGLSTAVRLSSMAVEKLWSRVAFTDGVLSHNGIEYFFTEEALASHTLPQLLSHALEPIFEVQFPQHPKFLAQLEAKQVPLLISEFLCGAAQSSSEAQRAAELYALPLGLAAGDPGALRPAGMEALAALPVVRMALGDSENADELSIRDFSARLRAEPLGLTNEAQRIVLAAMVAERLFDFVTSKGDRINYRSLDLQIIWDDIVGIAKSLNELYAPERLLMWAKLITGNAALKSTDRAEDRSLIVDTLAGWLAGWSSSRVLAEFDSLPDEFLSAGIWRTAANLRKSFGAMAEIIVALVRTDISLEACLQSIADLFSDSETDFQTKKLDLRVLQQFSAGVRKRSEIVSYLSLCERTGDDEIEVARLELIGALDQAHDATVPNVRDLAIDRWEIFQRQYAVYYADQHDRVMRSGVHSERLKEVIRSNEWAVFESLASVPHDGSLDFKTAKDCIRELRQLQCSTEVAEILSVRPFCGCSFSLNEAHRLARLPEQLEASVRAGIDSIVELLSAKREAMLAAADSGAMRSSLSSILDRVRGGAAVELTSQEIRVLRLTLQALSSPQAPSSPEPADYGEDTLEIWETEVTRAEDFVNTELNM